MIVVDSAVYVGRVGALAVALGVGVAVAFSPGVALATPESGTGAPANDSDTSPAQQDSPDTEPDQQPDDNDDEPEPEDDDVDPEAEEEPVPGVDEDLGVEDEEHDETPDQDVDEVEELDEDVDQPEPDDDPITREDEPDTEPALAPEETILVSPRDERHAFVEQPDSEVAAPAQTVSLFSAAREPALLTSAGPEPVAAQLTPTTPVAAFVAAPLSLVSSVLATALTPFLAPGPAAPANVPVLWAVLAWVRREINRTFFNQSPTLVDNQDITEVDDDTVEGSVTATDPDDDTLTYSYSGGQPGAQITVDADGNWTYTAPESWDGAYEYTDNFQITVTDQNSRPHWHGLLGFLRPASVHQDTVTVNVSIPSQIADDPEIVSATAGSPNAQTGAVTYEVRVRDHDGDDVPPELTAGEPASGTITRVRYIGLSDDGEHIYQVDYTPDPAARLAAYTTPGVDTDPFTITVADSDLRNGDAIQTINAAIDPTEAVVTNPVSVDFDPSDPPNAAAVGKDGTFMMADRAGTGTAEDPYRLVITLLRPGASEPQIVVTDATDMYIPPQLLDDGSVYWTTRSGQNTVEDPYVDTVKVLRPGQTEPESHVLPGPLMGAPQSGPDGTLVVVTYRLNESDPTAIDSIVTVLRPSTAPTTVTYSGVEVDRVVVGPGGHVAIASTSAAGTTVVVTDGQTTRSGTVSGTLGTVVVGEDGTTAVTTSTPAVTPGGAPTHSLTVLRNDGPNLGLKNLNGTPIFVDVGADGTVSVLTQNSAGGYDLTVLRPDQTTVSVTAVPSAVIPPRQAVGSDGTIAVTHYVPAANPTDSPTPRLTVLRPGDPVEFVTPDGALDHAAVVGADGTVALVTYTATGLPGISTPDPHLLVLRPDGSQVTTTASGTSKATLITDDGTVFTALKTADNATTVLVLRPGDDVATEVAVDGAPLELSVGEDGSVYLLTQSLPADPGDPIAFTSSRISVATAALTV